MTVGIQSSYSEMNGFQDLIYRAPSGIVCATGARVLTHGDRERIRSNTQLEYTVVNVEQGS